MKVPVIVRDAYVVWYEPVLLEGIDRVATFVHCDFFEKFTADLYKELYMEFYDLTQLRADLPLFALREDPADKKHHKFLTMFGFVPADEEGKIYKLEM